MDNKRAIEIFLRIPLVLNLVYFLFFREIAWMWIPIGVMFAVWAVLDALRLYWEGRRKFYHYVWHILIILGCVYIIIVRAGR